MNSLRAANKQGKRKAFLLALDSTPLSFLQENLSALPRIRSLVQGGRVLALGTPSDRFSAGVWQTFASGTLPGEHGHYFPMQWDAPSMKFKPIKGNTLGYEVFWDRLARQNIDAIVFDAMSTPISDGPSIQIVDWNTQCNFSARSNRPDLLKHIQRSFGKKPIGDEIAVKKSRSALEKLRDDLIQSVRAKTDAILWMMTAFDWRFFLSAYYEGHRAGHNLWPIWEDFASDPPEDAMLDVYREIDTQIGRLLEALDLADTMVILFSMHGMTPGFAQDHFLPPLMIRINETYLRAHGHELPRKRGFGLARVLRQTVPPRVQQNIREMVGQTVQDWLIDREWRSGKDWAATPAFPVPGGGDIGFIRLNVRGREREGFLPESGNEREGYIEFLRRMLLEQRVKSTGEPLIKDIIVTSDEFSGSRSHLLPDLLLRWQPDAPATEIYSEELGTICATLKTGRGGSHTDGAFAVLAGAVGDGEGYPEFSHIRYYGEFLDQFFART